MEKRKKMNKNVLVFFCKFHKENSPRNGCIPPTIHCEHDTMTIDDDDNLKKKDILLSNQRVLKFTSFFSAILSSSIVESFLYTQLSS